MEQKILIQGDDDYEGEFSSGVTYDSIVEIGTKATIQIFDENGNSVSKTGVVIEILD